VRIVAPSYPPNADTQASASARMAEVCKPRAWMVVDIKLQDANGPTGIECIPGIPCGGGSGTRNQQVDLEFVCVARSGGGASARAPTSAESSHRP
jgi:hypothetical protein